MLYIIVYEQWIYAKEKFQKEVDRRWENLLNY